LFLLPNSSKQQFGEGSHAPSLQTKSLFKQKRYKMKDKVIQILSQRLKQGTNKLVIHEADIPILATQIVTSFRPLEGFMMPSEKQMIDIAILFNDGILDAQKLSDMVSYAQFILDRLYETGDVAIAGEKEKQQI